MKKNNNQKNFIILLSLILVFTLTWVISNIYHSFSTSTIEIPLAESIVPIDGKFDTDTIEEIKNRKRVEVTNDIITPNQNSQNEEDIASLSAQLDEENDNEVSSESAETEL